MATEPHSNLEPRLSVEGFGSIHPITVVEAFKNTAEKYADMPALHFKPLKTSEFQCWTWSQYFQKSIDFAKSLISLGFDPHDRINISGFNAKEWHTSMMGTIVAGGIPAGVYPSNTPEQCKFIVEHSQPKLLVLQSKTLLEKYKDFVSAGGVIRAVVIYEEDFETENINGLNVFSFNDFLKIGECIDNDTINERMLVQKPGHCCSLIYTSGTTGFPKAVMISNDNATWTAKNMIRGHFGDMDDLGSNDRMVSYLPLSHIAAQFLEIFVPIITGIQVFFAQPDALKGSLVPTLKEVKPTFFFGVPRVYEKMHAKMLSAGATVKGLKRRISCWAKKVGMQKCEKAQFGFGNEDEYWPRAFSDHAAVCSVGICSIVWGIWGIWAVWICLMAFVLMYGVSRKLAYPVAKKLVFSKVRTALGLDQARYCFVAAAPIKRETLEYFASLDIPILEVFGQSECTGPFTLNSPRFWKLGTCGLPMDGTELRLDKKTGELQYRGRHIMMGYMKNPQATSEAIDCDGWLMSGDIANVDEDGFVSITGRIKELIITSGGENVAPTPIEACLKRKMPALSNAMVVGENRNYLCVLLTLQVEVGEDGIPTEQLTGEALKTSRDIGSSAVTTSMVRQDEKWQRYFEEGLRNANLEAVSNACTVKKWALLQTDFSLAGGEFTPTLKLRRSVTAEKYSQVIEGLYSLLTK